MPRSKYAIHKCPICKHPHGGRCGPQIEVYDSELGYRENQLIHLLCEGYTNQAIGDDLGIHIETVKRTFQTIFDKCGLDNRLKVALRYVRLASDKKILQLETELQQEREINLRLKCLLERETKVSNSLLKTNKKIIKCETKELRRQ